MTIRDRDSASIPGSPLAHAMQFLFDLFFACGPSSSGSGSAPTSQLANGRPTAETAKPPPARPSSQTNIRTLAATNAPVFF